MKRAQVAAIEAEKMSRIAHYKGALNEDNSDIRRTVYIDRPDSCFACPAIPERRQEDHAECEEILYQRRKAFAERERQLRREEPEQFDADHGVFEVGHQ